MRRRALIGSTMFGLAAPQLASPALGSTRGVIEIVTADNPPYAMARGPEPGFVLTLSAELFRMLGLQVVFRFLPWPEAEARARARKGVAIAPIHRTVPRESQFIWALTLFDDPSAFATLRARPPKTRAEAQELGPIAVLAGSRHEDDLRQHGAANVLAVPTMREAAAALDAGVAVTCFSAVPKLRAALREPRIGRPLFESPVWLALNPETDDILLPAMHDAYAALEADGSLEEILHPFLGYTG